MFTIIILTLSGEAQLTTHHTGIWSTPEVITHCAPGAIATHLYSTLTVVGTIDQSQVPFVTTCTQAFLLSLPYTSECTRRTVNLLTRWSCGDYWGTRDTSIFSMDTVVDSNWVGWAAGKGILSANTVDIVQLDWTSSLPVESISSCNST